MSLLNVGQIIPLEKDLEDFDGGFYYLRATILNKNNAVLFVVDMDNNGSGNFSNFQNVMPNLDLIKIRYEVFEDAAYANKNECYDDSNEIFSKLTVSPPDQETQKQSNVLSGIIKTSKLSGVITKNKLIGIIKEGC